MFFDEMNEAGHSADWLSLIELHAPRANKIGRLPLELVTMLRIHVLRQWLGLRVLAMEESPFETALYRGFVEHSIVGRLADCGSILRSRHLHEEHQLPLQLLTMRSATVADNGSMLKQGTAGDARFIAATSSMKNMGGERDPEVRQARSVTSGSSE